MSAGRSWTATVALAEQQNPEDWTWDYCIVCNGSPIHRGIYLLKTNGTVGRTAWCDRPKCVADRDGSAAFLLPDDEVSDDASLPLHRTEAGWPNCSTCDGGGCLDCTDPA